MSVYDRAMFRGPRPTGQPVKNATQMLAQEAGEKVVSDAMGGIASAKDPVQLMNAMRGDERTLKERRQELGGIVGMKDANKTPESVVTLVQPVMQMREAKAAVDQGIGQVAQKAMNTPVTDKMAGGIMQPVQMKQGGPATLQDFYEKNLATVQDIYGGDDDANRRQALGQILLGGVAPIGLQIAQGTPVAEALMPLGPMLAQQAAAVKATKDKRDSTAKATALQMAQSQLSDSQKLTQLDPEKDTYRGGVKISDGVQKFEPLSLMNQEGQVRTANTRDEEVAMRKEGFVFTPARAEKYSPVTLMNKDGKFETAFSQAEEGAIRKAGFVLTPERLDAFSPVTLQNQEGETRTATSPTEEATMRREGFVFSPERDKKYEPKSFMNKDGDIKTATSLQEETQFRQNGYVFNPERAGFEDQKLVYRRGANGQLEAKVATPATLEGLVNQGYTTSTPENFQFVRMVKVENGEPVIKTATSFEQQNQLISQGYNPYTEQLKTLGNKVLSISPAGTTVVYEQLESDPATLFNDKGVARVVNNKEQALAARQDGFHYTAKPETKGISRSLANALLVDLADDVANGTATPEQIRQFQTSVSVVRDTPRVVTGEGGESMVTIGGTVPPFVVEAVRRAKERDPEFNDMGLLVVPVEEIAQEQNYEGIIDPTIDYANSIGAPSKIGRFFGNVFDFGKSIAFGSNYNPTNKDSFKGANDLHFLNIITVTRALNAIGGKDTEGLRARIESLQVDPYSAGLTKSKLLNSTNNMVSFLKDNLLKLEDRYDTAPNPSIKDKVKSDIGEIEYLLDQYQLLQTNLMGTQGTAGTGPVDPNNSPSLTRPDG